MLQRRKEPPNWEELLIHGKKKAPVLAGRHRGRCCREGGRREGSREGCSSPGVRLSSPGCSLRWEVMFGKCSWSGRAGRSRIPCQEGTWQGLLEGTRCQNPGWEQAGGTAGAKGGLGDAGIIPREGGGRVRVRLPLPHLAALHPAPGNSQFRDFKPIYSHPRETRESLAAPRTLGKNQGEKRLPGVGRVMEHRPPQKNTQPRIPEVLEPFPAPKKVQGQRCGAGKLHGIRRSSEMRRRRMPGG